MFGDFEIHVKDVQCREYTDPKTNKTVYTYTVIIENNDDAVAILALNGMTYEDAPLNVRYWVPRNRGPRRERDEVPTVSFSDVKNQRGTVQIEGKVESYERPRFNRDESGIAQAPEPVSFKGARGSAEQVAPEKKRFEGVRRGDAAPISFNRNQFGTGLDSSDKKPRHEKPSGSVTLDFGRK